MGQLIFGSDMILPTKHMVDWELIRQQNNTKTNKDNTCKNRHGIDYDYNVKDDVMLNKHTAYKYETPYKGPFAITCC